MEDAPVSGASFFESRRCDQVTGARANDLAAAVIVKRSHFWNDTSNMRFRYNYQ